MKKLEPLRRRGTLDQRVRRVRKWMRRSQVGMIARHYPGAWRLFLKERGLAPPRVCILRDGTVVFVSPLHQVALHYVVKL